LGRTICKTLFGSVRLAQSKATKSLVAVKLSRLDHPLRFRLLESPESELSILRLLSSGNHGYGNQHVLRLLDEFTDEQYQWTVLEYAARGEFFDIVSQLGRVEEDIARHFFAQLVDGIAYIHAHGVAHLDLSLENLLLDVHDHLKICDFGVARRVCEPNPASLAAMPTYCPVVEDDEDEEQPGLPPEPKKDRHGNVVKPGKLGYMAPEIYSENAHLVGSGFDPRKADVFSAGVCLFMMLVGLAPWERPSQNDQRFQLCMEGRIKDLLVLWRRDDVPALALDLLGHMLCPYDKRYSIEDVLAHPWLRQGEETAESSTEPTAEDVEMQEDHCEEVCMVDVVPREPQPPAFKFDGLSIKLVC